MEDIISKLIERGLGNIMDKSRDPLILKDEIYLQDSKDLSELEDRYEALDLDKHDRMIIDDYFACAESVRARINDLSYIAGIRDTVLFLNELGLIKKGEQA